MTTETFMRQLEEHPGVGRLGRHVEHDPRSRRFAYDTSGLSIKHVRHARRIPVLDQGDLSSCTGNAAVGAVGSDPLFAALPSHPDLNEDVAVSVYSVATGMDEISGKYPPDDTGSTGLAAAKALRQLGWIVGFQHTFSLEDMLKALSVTTVMVGISWLDTFDEPDGHGRVKITPESTVRGGHEIVADEITSIGRVDHIGFTNSWSTAWGLGGRFFISFDDMSTLLANDGDVTVPVPAATPVPPVPPVPGPEAKPEDVELWADMQRWARTKGLAQALT